MSQLARIIQIFGNVGSEYTLRGWLYNRRSSGKIHFLTIRDGSGFIPAVMKKDLVSADDFESVRNMGQETSLEVTGTVRADSRAPQGYELDVSSVRLVGTSNDYPITPKEHGIDFLLDRRHLWLRSERQAAILRIRHEVINTARDYLNKQGFIVCDAPILTPIPSGGTTTVFPIQYFDDTTAYLTQSGQLYNEANAMALGKVYSFGPVFHAEKSKTRRHLTEFWMMEPQMAYTDLEDVKDLAECLIVHVIREVLNARETELKALERDRLRLEIGLQPFRRLTYDKAAQILEQMGQPFEYGTDFSGTDETVLSEHFGRPVCLTHHPVGITPFYLKPDPDDPTKALSVEVLAPEGYGVILKGGQRIDDLDLLLQRIKEHNLPQEACEWYLDLRRYGSVPHGGFSLCIERLVAWICHLEHVRETIPYPRMLYRLWP